MDMHGNHHGTDSVDGAADGEDEPAGHGMAMLGQKTVFLSHLPMFDPPHDYQVILEAELAGQGADPQQVYFEDRQKHPDEKLYTLSPSPFALTRILPTEGNAPKETSFVGSIVRRHFERLKTHPTKLASGVTVNVKNVIHGRKFTPEAPPPKSLEYILFGRGDEIFLAHLITSPPDFDQLIQVRLDHDLSAEELLTGRRVTIPSRSNTADERITSTVGDVEATLHLDDSTLTVTVTPGIEFYLEEDELS
jgi:hypothetical protein